MSDLPEGEDSNDSICITGSAGTDTITVGAVGADTITLDPHSLMSTTIFPNTITSGGYSYSSSGTSATTYTIAPSTYNWTSSNVNITGNGIDMAAGTDLKIDGKSLKEFINKMEERLAILVPDPAKLEKFEALKKAYDHYKLMEKLCQEEPKEEK